MKLFDAHFHIFEPNFPLVENQGFLPDPFTLADYTKWKKRLAIVGGVVVSGSMQAYDTTYLIHALKHLGPSFVGVAQIPANFPDPDILTLHEQGVRAVRFNVKRGGSATLDQIETLAHRVYDLAGWHVELYIDSKELTNITTLLLTLPKVSIDHLGLSRAGLPNLIRLAAEGVKVKATGFGRLDFEPLEVLKAIHQVNPEALMFGTDLPSTRAKRPFSMSDIDLIRDQFSLEDVERILWKNGASFYGFESNPF